VYIWRSYLDLSIGMTGPEVGLSPSIHKYVTSSTPQLNNNVPNTYTTDHSSSVLRTHSWRTAANSAGYLLPHLRPDMTILDVGRERGEAGRRTRMGGLECCMGRWYAELIRRSYDYIQN
jgi:hypothetical protein